MPRSRNKGKRNPLLIGAALGALAPEVIKKTVPGARKTVVSMPQRVKPIRDSQVQGFLRSADTSAVAAPVSVGMMMRGPSIVFSAAPVRGGLKGIRLQGRQIWGTLGCSTVTGNSQTAIFRPFGQTTAGSSFNGITFDPDDTATMPPPLTSLSQIFGRYSLQRCRIVYTPATQTSVAGAIAFAVNTDAAYVQATIGAFAFMKVMEQSNAVSTTPWATASIDVPCDGQLRFTSQSLADASLSYAEERQDHAFGMWVAANFTLTSPTDYGYFHVEYIVDFYEVQVGANEASLRRLEKQCLQIRSRLDCDRKVAREEKEKAADEKKEREERKTFAPTLDIEDVPPSLRSSVPPGAVSVKVKSLDGDGSGWRLVSR